MFFVEKLKKTLKHPVPKQLYYGPRKHSIVLSQMGTQFSDLNDHQHSKGCADSPTCSCTAGNETIKHYFLDCPEHINCREALLLELNKILPPHTRVSWEILIFGLEDCDLQVNIDLLNIVHQYMQNTNRF